MVLNKRGISGVITTVLMILLVIVAIGIVWYVIQSFVKESTQGLEGSADCLKINLEITEASISGTTLNVRVKKTAGNVEIKELKFILEDSLTSLTASDGLPELGEVKLFTQDSTSALIGNTIGVAAVMSDNTQCDISDEAEIE